jgi:hypothetical protein
LLDNLSVHAAVGKSVREGNRGRPDVRIYVGVKWDFEAPGKRRDECLDKIEIKKQKAQRRAHSDA